MFFNTATCKRLVHLSMSENSRLMIIGLPLPLNYVVQSRYELHILITALINVHCKWLSNFDTLIYLNPNFISFAVTDFGIISKKQYLNREITAAYIDNIFLRISQIYSGRSFGIANMNFILRGKIIQIRRWKDVVLLRNPSEIAF